MVESSDDAFKCFGVDFVSPKNRSEVRTPLLCFFCGEVYAE